MLRPRSFLFAQAVDAAEPPPAAGSSVPEITIDSSDVFDTSPTPAEPAPQPVPGAGSEDGKIDLADFSVKPVSLTQPQEDEPEPQPVIPQPPPDDKQPGPKQLREAYNSTKTKLDETTARVTEIETAKTTLEKEVQTLRAQLQEATKHLTFRDPSRHPDVEAIMAPINQEIASFPKTALMNGKQANALKTQAPALINEFRGIGEPTAEGYDERREAFLTKVNDVFGEHGGDVSRLISRAADALAASERKMAEIQQLGTVNGYQEAKDRHAKIEADFATRFESGFFQVSPEFAEANPFHSKTVIAKLIEANPKLKEKAGEIKKQIRRAAIPPAPINPRELEGMEPKERDAMLQRRMQEHREIQQNFAARAADAQFAFLLVGPMQQRIAELEQQLKIQNGETPRPKPAGSQPAPSDQQTDVKEFKLPTVSLRG